MSEDKQRRRRDRSATRTRWIVTAAVVTVLGGSRLATAHPVPFSYLDLRLQSGAIKGALTVHVVDLAHELHIDPPDRLLDAGFAAERMDRIARLFEDRLTLVSDGLALVPFWSGPEILVERRSVRFRLSYPLDRAPGALAATAYLFPYDTRHQTFVNVYEGGALRSQLILDANRHTFEHFAGTRTGRFAVLRRFAPAGIEHILSGPDHLLFLVGLLLLGGTFRQLAIVVTAFTVAHSVSLALAVLDVVTPPAWIIEPAIALSIVYVGADNLLVRGGRDLRAAVAFGFGFIHGFGFATALHEMDLPAGAIGWSLFAFNTGVEVGQLAVVAVVATVLAAVRARSETASHHLAIAGSIGVMAAGGFWFVQRVFFAGGM